MPGALSLFVCLSLTLASTADAATLLVRQDGTGDFTTIGAAVSAALTGDRIDVGPGTYPEFNPIEKSLTIFSSMGPAATILDGESSHRILFLRTETFVIEGFTFRSGFNVGSAGALLVANGGAVTIRDCVFENNVCGYDGGAFQITRNSRATVESCVFRGNYAPYSSPAGNAILGSTLTFNNCIFENNTTLVFSGAISCNEGSMDVRGCLFVNNSSDDVAGAIYYYRSTGVVENNTFFDHSSPGSVAGTVVVQQSPSVTVMLNILSGNDSGAGLRYYQNSATLNSCNVFWDNADGAIVEGSLAVDDVVQNPLFCGALMGNFLLSSVSPGAVPNSACGLLIGAFDVGCGAVAVHSKTWGAIKSIFK